MWRGTSEKVEKKFNNRTPSGGLQKPDFENYAQIRSGRLSEKNHKISSTSSKTFVKSKKTKEFWKKLNLKTRCFLRFKLFSKEFLSHDQYCIFFKKCRYFRILFILFNFFNICTFLTILCEHQSQKSFFSGKNLRKKIHIFFLEFLKSTWTIQFYLVIGKNMFLRIPCPFQSYLARRSLRKISKI